MVCPVANSRLWARLGGSIHRRALRDRFTNPALPAPPPPPPPPPHHHHQPTTTDVHVYMPLFRYASWHERAAGYVPVCTCICQTTPRVISTGSNGPKSLRDSEISLVNDFPRFDSAVRSISSPLKTTLLGSLVLPCVFFIFYRSSKDSKRDVDSNHDAMQIFTSSSHDGKKLDRFRRNFSISPPRNRNARCL